MNMPPKTIFFTDRNLGKQFPQLLKSSGIDVERHSDHFADDATDELWLEEIGKKGWFAITHDQRIRYRLNEKLAVRNYTVGLFIVIGKVPFKELALNFINTHAKTLKFIQNNQRPFIAKIYRPSPEELKQNSQKPGRVTLWESF